MPQTLAKEEPGLSRLYDRFHGHAPRKSSRATFHVPRGLVILGEAVAIEYNTDKYHGGGDGTFATYRHEFDRGAVMCMDETGKGQLYIIGSKIKVTSAGVVH